MWRKTEMEQIGMTMTCNWCDVMNIMGCKTVMEQNWYDNDV